MIGFLLLSTYLFADQVLISRIFDLGSATERSFLPFLDIPSPPPRHHPNPQTPNRPKQMNAPPRPLRIPHPHQSRQAHWHQSSHALQIKARVRWSAYGVKTRPVSDEARQAFLPKVQELVDEDEDLESEAEEKDGRAGEEVCEVRFAGWVGRV